MKTKYNIGGQVGLGSLEVCLAHGSRDDDGEMLMRVRLPFSLSSSLSFHLFYHFCRPYLS